ncbi:MAG: VWA domain-containing protein, partial [Planctomycetales bacterium]|nr:VWA domain-containing protein [Planctomycetales bacterium]
MTDWQISFDAPWLLALTGVLPLFWWIGRRSLRQLGTWRRSTAVGLRVLIAALIIGALAEPNWVAIGQRIAVLFLFDGSASIDRDEREQALQLVNAAASRRQAERGDRAGVIQFGQNAATEIPPVDDDWQLDRFETTIAPDFTDLSSAMRLAAASFPPDAARRVVLVTDGNENLGDALGEAERLWKDGVGIDVAPIRYRRLQEVSVDKVLAPPEASRGVPFDVRVVVSSAEPGTPVRGTLRLVRIAGDDRHLVSEQPVVVDSAKRVFSVRQKLEESGFFTYEATFVPDEAAGDRVANNQATAFSHVRGRGQVLLIEDAEQPGRFDRFASLLRRHEMEVTVRPSSQPFGDLADLQQFDAVLLADVPRVSGDGAEALTNFSNEQIETLVRNTQQLGCGLVVLGGPNSFGAGGWTNTPLEEA